MKHTDAGPTRLQFWIGTLLTITTILVGLWQTQRRLTADEAKDRRLESQHAIKELDSALVGVIDCLESHASMYVELEGCFTDHPTMPADCWRRDVPFAPTQAQRAWNTLFAETLSAEPYLSDYVSPTTLDTLRNAAPTLTAAIREHLPATDAKSAQAITAIILTTHKTLQDVRDDIAAGLSRRRTP